MTAPTIHPLLKPFDWFSKTAQKSDGLHRFAKVLKGTALLLAEHVAPVSGEAFKNMAGQLSTYILAFDGLQTISRMNEWVVPNVRTGRAAPSTWSTAKKCSRAFLTIGHVANTFKLGCTLNLCEMGVLSGKVVGNLSYFRLLKEGSIVTSAFFSMYDVVTTKICGMSARTRRLYRANFTFDMTKNIPLTNAAFNPMQQGSVNAYFQQLATIHPNNADIAFCVQKCNGNDQKGAIDHLRQVCLDNNRLDGWKHWLSIAADVAKVAIITMAWVVAIKEDSIAGFTLGVVGLVAYGLGYAKFLMGEDCEELKARATLATRFLQNLPAL